MEVLSFALEKPTYKILTSYWTLEPTKNFVMGGGGQSQAEQLAAILDFAVSAVLQAVSECPLRR